MSTVDVDAAVKVLRNAVGALEQLAVDPSPLHESITREMIREDRDALARAVALLEARGDLADVVDAARDYVIANATGSMEIVNDSYRKLVNAVAVVDARPGLRAHVDDEKTR